MYSPLPFSSLFYCSIMSVYFYVCLHMSVFTGCLIILSLSIHRDLFFSSLIVFLFPSCLVIYLVFTSLSLFLFYPVLHSFHIRMFCIYNIPVYLLSLLIPSYIYRPLHLSSPFISVVVCPSTCVSPHCLCLLVVLVSFFVHLLSSVRCGTKNKVCDDFY